MSDRIRIGSADSFTRLPAVISEGSRSFFLVRQASGFALLSNVCPHQGGAVYDKGTCFECPLHGWQFDRLTGRCLNAPSRALATIPVTAEDGVLYAEIPAPVHTDRVAHGGRSAKAGLTIQLHAHACLEISYEGFTILTDPWLDGPAFLGAWIQSPAPDASAADLRPDAILITHEHSDHFHEPTLELFDRRTPVFVPDFPNERLPRRLAALGFRDVHRVRFGEPTRIRKNWSLTTFEPASYWNDDALVLIDVDGFRIFDINDAGVNARIAKMAGPVDVLAVQFSAGASGYPWTWQHLSDDEKVEISRKACEGKLQLIREATKIYGASSVLPFASHFTLWHPSHRHYVSLMKRNTLDDVKAILADSEVDVIDLLPGDTWDVGKGVIRRAPDRQNLENPENLANPENLLTLAELAEYLLRLNNVPEIAFCEDVVVRMQADPIDLSFAVEHRRLSILEAPADSPNLRITVPLAIATAVVRQELSWDEAFIGYWCRFDRRSNVYHSGFWRLFQAPYYKRPVDVKASAQPAIDSAATVAELLEAHGDRADRILRRYGLYCLGCQHSTADSLAMAARQHGLEPKRCDRLIKELNQTFHGEALDKRSAT